MPESIFISLTAKADPFVALFALLAIYCALLVNDRPAGLSVLILSVAAAMAIMIKLTALPVLVVVAVTLWLNRNQFKGLKKKIRLAALIAGGYLRILFIYLENRRTP